MLNWVPMDFSSLLSILCYKAVLGVGGTVCGVPKEKDSKHKGWGHGEDENKPEKASTSSTPNKSNSSLEVLQVSATFCF